MFAVHTRHVARLLASSLRPFNPQAHSALPRLHTRRRTRGCVVSMAMYEDLELPGTIVAAVVGVLHLYFMALEAFMWRGRARRVFGTKKAVAELTAPLAANQVRRCRRCQVACLRARHAAARRACVVSTATPLRAACLLRQVCA